MRLPRGLAAVGLSFCLTRTAQAAQPQPPPLDSTETSPADSSAPATEDPAPVAAPEPSPPVAANPLDGNAPPATPTSSSVEPKAGVDTLDDEPGIVRGRHEPVVNTLRGPIGLFHTTLPDVGGNLTVRFRLHTDFFRAPIIGTDENSRVRGAVNLGFTPWKYLEIFLAIGSQANRNQRTDADRQDPEALFALGDIDFGLKGAYAWNRYGLAVGGLVGLGLLSGTERLLTNAVNFWFDGLFSFDLRHVTEKQIPIRLSTNVGWILDRSLNLFDWDIVTDRDSREVVRFALGANHPRVRMRYALDFPVRLGKEKQFGIDPVIEWSWDISTQQDERFLIPNYEARLPRSMSWLTLGARGNVWHGLHLDAAVDVGLISPKFEYGPPVPAWQVILGLAWSFETRPVVKNVEVAAPAAPEPPPAAEGRIVGKVLGPDGAPVAGASVSFPGAAGTSVITDATGAFTSFRFPAGPVLVRVEIDGQRLAETSIAVVAGEDTPATIQLEQPPAPPTGLVRGAFVGPRGTPIAASMRVVGQGVDETFQSTPDGLILLELYVGDYQAVISAEGYKDKEIQFTVPRDGEIQVQETFAADKPPETPLVRASKRRIRLVGGIRYSGQEVSEQTHAGLDQLATFLKVHPEYRVVEVAVHTDDRGNPRQRSETRAEAIRTYLVGKGVAPDRIVAKGYGASRPIAVNMTASGRAKNNRTELVVRDYQDPAKKSKAPSPSGPAPESESESESP